VPVVAWIVDRLRSPGWPPLRHRDNGARRRYYLLDGKARFVLKVGTPSSRRLASPQAWPDPPVAYRLFAVVL